MFSKSFCKKKTTKRLMSSSQIDRSLHTVLSTIISLLNVLSETDKSPEVCSTIHQKQSRKLQKVRKRFIRSLQIASSEAYQKLAGSFIRNWRKLHPKFAKGPLEKLTEQFSFWWETSRAIYHNTAAHQKLSESFIPSFRKCLSEAC